VSEHPIVRVHHLTKRFPLTGRLFSSSPGYVRAVDDISFDVRRGETMGIVGESGCGKSTTAKMLIGLMKPTQGEVFFQERNVFKASEAELRMLRRDMQIIFQDSSGSLNPRMTAADLICEPLKIQGFRRQERELKLKKLMETVGLAAYQAGKYPHEFSGGQRQRIGIARALALGPTFVICDEPLSALDVSVQSQIINLLKDLQAEYGLTYLFISHDLAVIRHICDTVAIMYLGKIVESGPVREIFANPLHPYTEALLSSIPVPDPAAQRKRILFKGEAPSPVHLPTGCRFHPRCLYVQEICRRSAPDFVDSVAGHFAACHFKNARRGMSNSLEPVYGAN
jgi:oligopeptide/dipeptide ABC transporter ATP-binding protein